MTPRLRIQTFVSIPHYLRSHRKRQTLIKSRCDQQIVALGGVCEYFVEVVERPVGEICLKIGFEDGEAAEGFVEVAAAGAEFAGFG